MAEVLHWNEGSAQLITGGATSLMVYVQSVTVRPNIGYHVYRPPFNGTYQYIETGRVATVRLSQHLQDKVAQPIFNAATAGGVHLRLTHLVPGAGNAETWLLFSGILESVNLDGSDGAVMGLSFEGQFQNWTMT